MRSPEKNFHTEISTVPQLTHKYNYNSAGKALGANFVDNPDLVATNQWAFKTAGWFWQTRNLNSYADKKGEFPLTIMSA